MRDPERIDRVLAALAYAWKKNPDLRLGQIMMSVSHDGPGMFNVEDEGEGGWVERLRSINSEDSYHFVPGRLGNK